MSDPNAVPAVDPVATVEAVANAVAPSVVADVTNAASAVEASNADLATVAPAGSVAAWLAAEAVRYGVPATAALIVMLLAKTPLHLSYDWAGLISVALGGGISAGLKWLESKFPWAKRILLAKKPAGLK